MPGDDEIEIDVGAACPLIDRGAEIVITPDGRVTIVNPSEDMIEVALSLDPENDELKKRLEAFRAARAKRAT